MRSEKIEKRRSELVKAKAVKARALFALDNQNLPPSDKKFKASAEETIILLDAGADILKVEQENDFILVRLMYEAIPVEYTGLGFKHPRLTPIKKAGS